MAYRKATIRNMPPRTRAYAHLLNELESVHRRLRNLTFVIQGIEIEARASMKATEAAQKGGTPHDQQH